MSGGVRHRKRNMSPLARLILEIRTAARQIEEARARAIAAREASSIVITRTELRQGIKGRIAAHARALMKTLPSLDSELERHEAAQALARMADVLESQDSEEVLRRLVETRLQGIAA